MLLKRKKKVSMMKSKRKSENTSRQTKMKTTLQSLWDTTKAVLRGKFTAIQVFLKK